MKEQTWIKKALVPFSWVYGLITDVRNLLYDRHVFSSTKVPQYVISVGNLTVGGTGKTPVIEYLVNLLSGKIPTAILSRGYGRSTRGFLKADESANATSIGDEPFQFYNKFRDKVVVAVCEKRVTGAMEIANLFPERKLLLLDDAFQHRAIRRDINLLLNDYNRPFYHDLPFPAGRLRENRKGAQRADAVIVTKCPDHISRDQKAEITSEIRRYTGTDVPVFFASTHYAEAMDFRGSPVSLNNVKIVAGIARPEPFCTYLRAQFNVVDQTIFPDHHNYSAEDVQELIKNLKNDTFVVTTEKDMVKLKPLVEQSGRSAQFAYIPVAVQLGDDADVFSKWISSQFGHRF